jgi:hypothetical protein
MNMKRFTQLTTLLAGASLAAALFFGGATSAFAGAGTVTVVLKASDGVTGVPGATVSYYKSGKQTLGVTDASGSFSAYIANVTTTTVYLDPPSGGTRIWLLVDPATNPTLTAQMVAVTIELKTCAGAPLVGLAKYYRGGWQPIGNTPVTLDLLPYTGLGPGQGSYDFLVEFEGRSSATTRQDVSVNPNVVINTTKVTLYGGPIWYYNGGWQVFVSPKEMAGGPGKYADFKFGSLHSATKTLSISGCDVTGGMLTLLDASGKGLAGGVAKPAIGGGWQPDLPGTTDANGQLWYAGDLGVFTKIKMTINQSSQEQLKAALLANGYKWQTATATINVKHWDGTGFAGIVIDQGGGHWVGGIATTDASGVAKVPMFAGSSGKFRANWNKTAQEITQGIPSTFVFQTGQVHSTGGATTTWATGTWNTFVQDMEIFPGSYRFGPPTLWYTIYAGVVNNVP